MSTTAGAPHAEDPGSDEAELTSKQRRILDYLRDQAETRTYFKSRLIGEALDLSAKEVGANIAEIRDGDVDIEIEPWGSSGGTTWQVTE